MLLNRLGNKRLLAEQIISHFPPHNVYVEMFFGSGAVFFAKPRCEYNILNDNNSEVMNLFVQVKDNPDELRRVISITPYSHDVFKYLKSNQFDSCVWRAVRLLYVANFSFMGAGDTLKVKPNHYKDILLENLETTIKDIAKGNNIWTNVDYTEVFNVASLHQIKHIHNTFVYADPPYVGTSNKYGDLNKRIKWDLNDFSNLINHLQELEIQFAISEFNNPDFDDIITEHNLNKIIIRKRMSVSKLECEEILITNYKLNTLF